MTKEKYSTVWDTKLQQFHAGQDWKFLDNFIEDFSVTTNGLGTPKSALEASREACFTCHHYPSADQEPAKTSLAQFLWPDDYKKHSNRLLLGNGASELIDLVIRSAPDGTWKPGPWDVQYKEYQRSAENNGRIILSPQDNTRATLSCIVNPCNPTGDYKNVAEMKKWILDNVEEGGVVIVDESMQPWLSSDFRSDSLISQHDFAYSLYKTKNISLYIIHSWTKFWSCTGLRLGSVVCPTSKHFDALKKIQVPWSVNSPALAFLNTVVRDQNYMDLTWKLTSKWRAELIDRLKVISNSIVTFHNDPMLAWEFYGNDFLSWVWIDMKTAKISEDAVNRAKAAGVPIRSGKPGYNRPTHVRVAVREPSKVDFLIQAWKDLGTQ
ncbi:pyridoxal phosphate-dependent transferase [Gigaspora rosea]|uniref:Pyridoxal phosphate-dependent transferase n=1 Tax=Gigaspora rosea TaxID=44941 RepID=A0A397UFC7_9GLOM|nr:pyridoxal phosphate-dependent transferase [Gigaspora rosea]CAG8612406.1 15772_t:CDS:2 [Gigaspora rosea]